MEVMQELFTSPVDFVVKGGIFVAVIFLLSKFHNVDKSLMRIDDKLNLFMNDTNLRITHEVTEAKLTVKDSYVSKDECKENRSYIYRDIDRISK